MRGNIHNRIIIKYMCYVMIFTMCVCLLQDKTVPWAMQGFERAGKDQWDIYSPFLWYIVFYPILFIGGMVESFYLQNKFIINRFNKLDNVCRIMYCDTILLIIGMYFGEIVSIMIHGGHVYLLSFIIIGMHSFMVLSAMFFLICYSGKVELTVLFMMIVIPLMIMISDALDMRVLNAELTWGMMIRYNNDKSGYVPLVEFLSGIIFYSIGKCMYRKRFYSRS